MPQNPNSVPEGPHMEIIILALMFFKFQLLMKEDCFLTCLSKNIDLEVLDLKEKKILREIYEQQDTFFEAFLQMLSSSYLNNPL